MHAYDVPLDAWQASPAAAGPLKYGQHNPVALHEDYLDCGDLVTTTGDGPRC